VKRERSKPVPADFDLWEFACKVGADAPSAETKDLREVGAAIDAIAAAGATSVYVEVQAHPGKRAIVHRVTLSEKAPPPTDSAL
jgi:hypothetical protein